MRTWNFSLWLCSALCLAFIAPAETPASDARFTPMVRAVRRVEPSIVDINTERPAREGGSGKVHGMGTGIIIDERGYIVTNQHVVDNTTMLKVTLHDNSTHKAELISYDRKHDLAIIKIDGRRVLPVAPFGTSSDVMKGESVIAIGNPFGYEHSTSVGIVSALGRNVEVNDTQSYQNLIQTDASINPGNSGGPLINLDGEVIGINVAIRAGAQRIGFALPIDDARGFIAKLLDVRQLDRTFHGIEAHDVKTPEHRKLVVDGAESNSPSAAAGFLPGDVVTQIGSRPVVDRVDLERGFLGQPAGTPIEVHVKRNQETVKLTMQLARMRDAEPAPRLEPRLEPGRSRVVPVADTIGTRIWNTLGLRLERAQPTVLTPFQSRYKGGMKVVKVRAESPAARHGIVEGDVLVGLSQWETKNTEDVKWILDQPKLSTPDEPLKFFVVRGTEVLAGEMKVVR